MPSLPEDTLFNTIFFLISLQAEKRMAEEVLQREEKIRHIEIDRAKLESEKLQLESEYKTEIAKLEERSKADMEKMAREHEDQVRTPTHNLKVCASCS